MKCVKCGGEWTPPPNIVVTRCLFCNNDLTDLTSKNLGILDNESILANLIEVYGFEILEESQKLNKLIEESFFNDTKVKNLLLVSIRENVQLQLLSLINIDSDKRKKHIDVICVDLENNAFLSKDAIKLIIQLWVFALKLPEVTPLTKLRLVHNKGFSGIENPTNRILTEIKFDDIKVFEDGFASVKLNGKWGIMNNLASLITEIKYDGFLFEEQKSNQPLFYCGFTRVVLNGKWGFIDKNGNEVIKPKYQYIRNFSEDIAAVNQGDKWAFIDKNGNEITLFKYIGNYGVYGEDLGLYFSEGMAKVRVGNKYGFINIFGEEVIPLKYEDASNFEGGLAKVVLNDLVGYIDKDGLEVIPHKYSKILSGDFQYGYARVSSSQGFGFIDKIGNEIIPLKYPTYGFILKSGLFCLGKTLEPIVLNKNGIKELCYGIVDRNNTIILPFIYQNIAECFKMDLLVVKLNDKYGLIDFSGKEITPVKYDRIMSFSENIATVKLNDKWGYINENGRIIANIRYDKTDDFINGCARVMINNKYGVINIDGEEFVTLKYDDINEFSEGLAVVKLNGKCGYIDRNGEVIIPLIYDYALDFRNGLSSVRRGYEWAVINKAGEILTAFKYESIWSFREDFARVRINEKYGFVNRLGKEVIPIVFKDAEDFKRGFARVKLVEDYSWRFIDKFGDFVIVSDEILDWYKMLDNLY